jgi:hypothetical protein
MPCPANRSGGGGEASVWGLITIAADESLSRCGNQRQGEGQNKICRELETPVAPR